MEKQAWFLPLLILLPSLLFSQLTFEPKVEINKTSSEVGVADFNMDGHVDIAITGAEQRWYEGPDFTVYHVLGYSDGGPYAARVADMNGDGWADFVTSDGTREEDEMPGNLYLYLNPGPNGDPTLEWQRIIIYTGQVRHQNDIRIADMDGDGLLDVIERTWSSERVVVALQNTDINNWTVRVFDTGETGKPEGISAGDIDGDGENEIILSGVYWDNPGGWRTGNPIEFVVDPVFIQEEVKSAVGDIDNDGDMDIYMGSCEGAYHYLAWYENTGPDGNGGVSFVKHIIKDNTGKYHMVELVDIDFDGDLDLATGKSFGDFGTTIFYNENDGASWTESVYDGTGTLYTGIVADLDGDGDYDVIGPKSFYGKVYYYINNTPGDPPLKPSNTTASLIDPLDISITWTDNAINEGTYEIQRLNNLTWSPLATLPSNTISYLDQTTQPSNEYVYRVRAANAAGVSEWDSSSSVVTWDIADTVNITPSGGSFVNPPSITMFTDEPVDEIRFTIDGSLPDENANLFTAPFQLSTSAEVKAIAIAQNKINSIVASEYYNIAVNGNFPPEAHAGIDQNFPQIQNLVLDGSATFDLDDPLNTLSFLWTQLSGPAGTLTNESMLSASFLPLAAGVYNFELSVSDEAETDTDTVQFIVNDLDANVIAYWPMDENLGSTITELVEGNDGIATTNVTYFPYNGKVAGALKFNGVDTRVTCPSIDVGGSEMTITFWMNASDLLNVEGRMLSKASDVGSSTHVWMVSQISGSGLRFRLNTDSGGTTTLASGTGAIPIDEWIFVAARYDGTTMKIYKNGTEIVSVAKTGAITQANVPVCIGNQPVGAGERPFSGFLDEMRIFDVALTESEINDLYLDSCTKYQLISNLTLTEDMSFIAKNAIELVNVTVPAAFNLNLTSQNLIIGNNCNLIGPCNLITTNNITCP